MPPAGNKTGSKDNVCLTAGCKDSISCIPKTFAGVNEAHHDDHFGTKYDILRASFAFKSDS